MTELLNNIKSCKTVEKARELLYYQIEFDEDIEKALNFCIFYHEGQYRKSGEEYAVHPILVAYIVSYFGGDKEMIIASLLHDVVEDTECTIEQVRDEFSESIANLVGGLTKIVEIRDENLISSAPEERLAKSALSFRKMLVASIGDVRVLVIKLCDRLHNMLTIEALREEKRKRIAEETLMVYAPIAHRLGISRIKNILEDISFSIVLPKEYEKIDKYLKEHTQQLQLKLNHFISKVHNLLLNNGFIEGSFELEKRIKHHYSIYLKMQRKGISIEEVLDLLAIRIIVDKPLDCYRALGAIHLNFSPLISRFKDYVAVPKENGYQTIHTTVFDDKSIIEAQIRTFSMHKTAEFGLAAHWKYKESGLSPKLEWLEDLQSTENGNEDIQEFYEHAKSDLYSEDISVFSPKGDIFTLPRGVTALDFAYVVHTEIGDRTKEIYVNKQKVPLLTKLKNGDIVNVVVGKKPIYRCSWINSLKTSKARNAISLSCRQKTRELNKKVAVNILATIFHTKPKRLLAWLRKEKFYKKLDRIAVDSQFLKEVVKVLNKYSQGEKMFFPILKIGQHKIKKQKFEHLVFYADFNISNVLFDYCCNPKIGDDIVAFKKGSTVTIHHKLCEKAMQMIENNDEMVFVKWA
ncbi:MAG: bifunctional (p)ppGpp synthetase/guanosine-3',5'-bis(diphosphate) 3'-pyrophosphohydrolase, partial [Epsilonproteobacteria bacterium]|nr:bifunctional (p)ppGpp synthetase/guanosine-3',5'-bis(diphosphate) 3'-pyrophosphohydrolase [Campylobacterota bacterium]